jgi:hypothetical protein
VKKRRERGKEKEGRETEKEEKKKVEKEEKKKNELKCILTFFDFTHLKLKNHVSKNHMICGVVQFWKLAHSRFYVTSAEIFWPWISRKSNYPFSAILGLFRCRVSYKIDRLFVNFID